jgi:NTP pyrophosphatase (non-canonical NTP hydrolase)
MDMKDFAAAVKEFSKERDWEQFHSPKNLAIALSVEASELLEVFQWLSLEQSDNLDSEMRANAKDEIGDVMICLVNLCNRLGIDPLDAATEKLAKVKLKYPVDKAKGLANKYSKL